MDLVSAFLIVNAIALFGIYLSPSNKTPLYTSYSFITYRVGGVVPLRDIIVTFSVGALLAHLSDTDVIFCTILEFMFGMLLHWIFKPKTMVSYMMNICDKPDGTGKLALPILSDS